jgi:hypothetical protein
MEGRDLRVSQQVLEWQAEARAEATVAASRETLVRVLEARCGAKMPADLASHVQATIDAEQLSRWFDAALKARSYDEFRAAISA